MKKIRGGCLLLLFVPVFASAQYRLLTEDSLRSLFGSTYAAPSAARNSVGLELLMKRLPGSAGFDSVKNILVSESETSRERAEMCRVNLGIARAYLGYYLNYEYAVKARPYLDRVTGLAEESDLDLYKVGALLQNATLNISSTQMQKALDCNNQALALALSTGNDSLVCLAYGSLARTYEYLDNKISRLQALLTARTYAEKSGQPFLILRNLLDLAVFYRDAEQMEKSRDFYTQAVKDGTKSGDWDLVVDARRGLGLTYRIDHNKPLARAAYDSALKMADRHGLRQAKVNTTLDLLNYYFNEETPDSGLAYLAGNPELGAFIRGIGVAHQINKVYAAKYEGKGDYDSALYFLKTDAPLELNQPQAFYEKYDFSMQWARVLQKSGHREEALQQLLAAARFADSAADLQKKRDVSEALDSAYLLMGDYKNALFHYSRYNHFRDTLETLGRQKDLMNAEIEDAGKRAEVEKQQAEDKIRRRDNLQYMAITAAIATLFVLLMVLGVFRMSVSVIKALGFISFIFLFEFIILLLDKQIHELTHGEPVKVLAIKIVVIALLLPLHHYLEHRAVHFLTSRAHLLRQKFRPSPPSVTADAESHS